MIKMNNMELIKLANEIGNRFKVSSELIIGKRRPAAVCDARFLLYVMLSDTGASSKKVGRILGRTHVAILRGIRRYKKLIQVDNEYLSKSDKVRFDPENKKLAAKAIE